MKIFYFASFQSILSYGLLFGEVLQLNILTEFSSCRREQTLAILHNPQKNTANPLSLVIAIPVPNYKTALGPIAFTKF